MARKELTLIRLASVLCENSASSYLVVQSSLFGEKYTIDAFIFIMKVDPEVI